MKYLLALALLGSISCNDDVTGLGPPSDPATDTFAASLPIDISQMTRLLTGVYIQDSIIGTGAEVTFQTDTIWVTYAGFLKDGKLFDSGINVKFQPVTLVAGFRGGVTGMKVGGKRKLVIPSEQGYGGNSIKGSDGKIKIPRQSTLVFIVDLLKLHTPTGPTGPAAAR